MLANEKKAYVLSKSYKLVFIILLKNLTEPGGLVYNQPHPVSLWFTIVK